MDSVWLTRIPNSRNAVFCVFRKLSSDAISNVGVPLTIGPNVIASKFSSRVNADDSRDVMLSKFNSSRLRALPSTSSTENNCTVLAVNCLSFVTRHARSIEISVVSLSASSSTRPFSPSLQTSSKFSTRGVGEIW